MYQFNGKDNRIKLAGQYRIISRDWGGRSMVPHLVYMPEKDRLAMMLLYQQKHLSPALAFSDDRGRTWGRPRYLHTDVKGNPDAGGCLTLSYLGNGKLLTENFGSKDYGDTWQPLPEQHHREVWHPVLADRDPNTGEVVRLVKTYWSPLRKWAPGLTGPYAQGYVRFSYDEGKTWKEEKEVREWLGVNEVALTRAKNGDLVAACRLDPRKRLEPTAMDDYAGLGVSISRDNGGTWSNPRDPEHVLYDWGRHHASMVLMPGGDLVMTYIVRRGYPNTAGGRSQFGIEAVISHDNGRTWDLDHRYLLHAYKCKTKAMEFSAYASAPSNTSTVLLPDGSLLTAFSVEYSRIGLMRWRLNSHPVSADSTIRKAPFDSDLRNKLDPCLQSSSRRTVASAKANIAVPECGAMISSSHGNLNPSFLLEDPYLYSQFPPGVIFDTIPAWVEISWPVRHRIDEIRVVTGDPKYQADRNLACIPLDYRLEYRESGRWTELTKPVENASGRIAYTWHDERNKPVRTHRYAHKFEPLETDAIRLTITRSSDTGVRTGQSGRFIVPMEKRNTFLKLIEVFQTRGDQR